MGAGAGAGAGIADGSTGMESNSLKVPEGIAEAETTEATAVEDAMTADWPALRSVEPAMFIKLIFPVSTWLYMELPAMVTINSVPRIPMVAFGVDSLKACFLC